MYEVKVLSEFSASHHLRDYGGKCERRHGHNWKVEIICEADTLDNIGLVVDFKWLKEKVKVIVEELDHVELNDLDYFKKFNPSSENIAYYIFMQLSKAPEITQKVRLRRVNIWENDSSRASYYE
ncbi:MAG: 6-carboxytetrahydropterin synthase QueD [Candidatus Omnitrophica bacterium]|nr:6-carboxytetrahydropterin synthase QueD [Candidatus Omnitrophota bacterium]